MIPSRFSDELTSLTDRVSPQPMAGFLAIPVAVAEAAQASPLQTLYQQMYQQAVQAQSRPTMRDLFAIMN